MDRAEQIDGGHTGGGGTPKNFHMAAEFGKDPEIVSI